MAAISIRAINPAKNTVVNILVNHTVESLRRLSWSSIAGSGELARLREAYVKLPSPARVNISDEHRPMPASAWMVLPGESMVTKENCC